jgi:D-alanyl-D-alanine carboxypeptidase
MAVDSAALQEALAETGQRHGPGLFGLVTDDGEVVFEGSVGVADVVRPRPIDARDRFRIGSVTKTYVAALVLQLVAEGTLTLADPVERWLPDAVPPGGTITVEMLLRMRSGLPDYPPAILGAPPDVRVLQRYWTPEDLVQLALTVPGRLAPDAEFRYSNTDYVLLGLIVERATGQRIDAQLWQRVFQPLGLHDTSFPTVDPYLRGPHATGYLRETDDSPYVECTTQSPSELWTAGAIVATARDVAAFLDGLLTGRLLDPDGLARMTDCTQAFDGYRTRGLSLIRYDFGAGGVAFGQQGGVPGYTTVALRTTAGRCVVLWQNGIDLHYSLSSDAPFIRAAVSA